MDTYVRVAYERLLVDEVELVFESPVNDRQKRIYCVRFKYVPGSAKPTYIILKFKPKETG